MPRIELETLIHAPIGQVFDLARSVDVHTETASQTGEKAVGGRTSGLLELGETVTWEARHFGVAQRLTVEITALDRPYFFEDVMRQGIFAQLRHRHEFRTIDGTDGPATLMRDVFEFSAPLGLLGRLAERLFLTAYMRRFLVLRNRSLQEIAESSTRAIDDPKYPK